MKSRATWFLDQKIHVFPIKQAGLTNPDGSITKGKEPDCRSWDDYRCGRSVAAKFINYGIVLGIIGVVDSDDPETELWVINNIPPTPFVVNTARGKHRYFRLIHDAPHFFHRAGHTIEFRHRGQYVVGPGSTHASGYIYTADDWSWDIHDVPIFPVKDFNWDDRTADERGTSLTNAFILPPRIHAGERHDLMFKLMRSLQARGIEDVDQILTVIHAENLIKCQPPIPEQELTTYIRRVVKHPDRKDFKRLEIVDLSLAINLTEVGLSQEAVKLASGVDPLTVADIIPDYATFEEPPDDPSWVPPSDVVLAVTPPAVVLPPSKPKKRKPKRSIEEKIAQAEAHLLMLKYQINEDDLEIVEDNSEEQLETVEVDNIDDF